MVLEMPIGIYYDLKYRVLNLGTPTTPALLLATCSVDEEISDVQCHTSIMMKWFKNLTLKDFSSISCLRIC